MKKAHKIISLALVLMLLFGCVSVLPISAAEKDTDPSPAIDSFQFENSLDWSNVYFYAWNADSDELTGSWPGIPAELVDEQDSHDIYQINVPYGAVGIIISDGEAPGNQTAEIVNFSPMGGGYYLTDSITVTDDLGSTVYNPVPFSSKNVPAIESRCIIGDTDSNDTININDVTALQKHLAQAAVPNGFNLDAADVDLNKDVNINDATMIQYYLAGKFNNTSNCGEVLKGGRLYYNMRLDFTDRLGWGRVSVFAFDEDKNMLPGAYVEDGYWSGSYDLMIPGDTDSIVVVSEDYTKSTTLCTDLGNGFGTHYVAWDKSNEEYVLCFHGWGGLVPQFYFINTLGWEHVTLVSYDRFGNVEDYDELSSDGNNRYFASVSTFASKVYIMGDNGEKTDLITGYYCVPGQEDVYYLDSSKTTVNDKGETVYVPILSTSTTEEEFPEDTVTFKFTNSLNWTDLYVYAWDENGSECCGEWRGKPLVSTEQDDFGTDVYTVTLPVNAVGAVISANEGQTTDITDFSPAGGGYYLTDKDTVLDSVFGQTTYIPVEWGESE